MELADGGEERGIATFLRSKSSSVDVFAPGDLLHRKSMVYLVKGGIRMVGEGNRVEEFAMERGSR